MRILITGASGSGTTTLGRALAATWQCPPLDADDFYWLPTQPPFSQERDAEVRNRDFENALRAHDRVVISGSVSGWQLNCEDLFSQVVFLRLDTALRIERLKQREIQRYGRFDPTFIAWAADYDTGPARGRSLAKHQTWLATLACPVLTLEGDMTVAERVAMVHQHCQPTPQRQPDHAAPLIPEGSPIRDSNTVPASLR